MNGKLKGEHCHDIEQAKAHSQSQDHTCTRRDDLKKTK